MCCVYERVSKHEPHPCSVDWLCSLKGKRQATLSSEGRMVNVIKNSGGRQRVPMLLWIRSSEWLWGRSLTPPSAQHSSPRLSLPPPQLMIHNGFLCFNEPDALIGSFLPVHIEVCTQVLSVKQTQHISVYFLHIAIMTWLIVLVKWTVINVAFVKLLRDTVYATQDPPIYTHLSMLLSQLSGWLVIVEAT